MRRILGPGSGLCLDLGCGTGRFTELIRATGRTPVGIDVSADQLRIARRRGTALALADARSLPFRDGSFPAVVGMWISTDVDDFAAAAHEVARVLAPGGVFVFHGVHPCFNGPCVEHRANGALIIHATYQRQGRHTSAPWWRPGGIRERVGGMNHISLATLLNTFLAAGLSIRQVAEFDGAPIPNSVTVRATKTVVPV